MIENFEYKGEWFLPNSKDKRINGVLKFDSINSSLLELFGSFEENLFTPPSGNLDIIWGLTSKSKQITLYVCVLQGFSFVGLERDESGVPITTYRISYILEGIHIEKKEELLFDTVKSEINYLDLWVDRSGFWPYRVDKNYEVNIHYSLPENVKFKIDKELEGEFQFLITVPYNGGNTITSITLEQSVLFILSSKRSLGLEELLKLYYKFQNFLVLSLYNKIFPLSLIFFNENFVIDYGDGIKIKKPIKVYFPLASRGLEVKSSHEPKMIFNYQDIMFDFPAIIAKWYEKYDLLESALNLVLEQFYNSKGFSENNFLNLAQSVETFHSRTNNRTKMPKSDYAKMKKEILSVTPNSYHKWLNDQFNFGNSLSLHDRLTEIVSKYSNEVLDKIIGDKELFINQVKWSRNYYTHYSVKGRNKALKGAPLYFLTEKLKAVLVCAFLIEVGFDKEKLNQVLNKNKHNLFNHLLIRW